MTRVWLLRAAFPGAGPGRARRAVAGRYRERMAAPRPRRARSRHLVDDAPTSWRKPRTSSSGVIERPGEP